MRNDISNIGAYAHRISGSGEDVNQANYIDDGEGEWAMIHERPAQMPPVLIGVSSQTGRMHAVISDLNKPLSTRMFQLRFCERLMISQFSATRACLKIARDYAYNRPPHERHRLQGN